MVIDLLLFFTRVLRLCKQIKANTIIINKKDTGFGTFLHHHNYTLSYSFIDTILWLYIESELYERVTISFFAFFALNFEWTTLLECKSEDEAVSLLVTLCENKNLRALWHQNTRALWHQNTRALCIPYSLCTYESIMK